MFIEPSDIIIVQNVIFKDSNEYAFTLHGHPAVVIHTTDELFYYLILSSSFNNKGKKSNQHYPVFKKPENKLKVKSYINLKYIYRSLSMGHISKGYFDDETFLNIMLAFKYYQENIRADELYPEIENSTNELIRRLKPKF